MAAMKLALVLTIAAVCTAAAAAATSPKVEHTAAGTKAAQASLLRIGDFGSGWTSSSAKVVYQVTEPSCWACAASCWGVIESRFVSFEFAPAAPLPLPPPDEPQAAAPSNRPARLTGRSTEDSRRRRRSIALIPSLGSHPGTGRVGSLRHRSGRVLDHAWRSVWQ